MIKIAALVSLILAVIFWCWSLSHGIWQWQLFLLAGLALWCARDL